MKKLLLGAYIATLILMPNLQLHAQDTGTGSRSECTDPMYKDLWTSVLCADVQGVQSALEKGGFDINHKNSDGFTILLMAIISPLSQHAQQLSIVKLLLQAGADPNVQMQHVDTACTALMAAACYGLCNLVHELLEAGVDPNIQDKDGSTALTIAAQYGYTAIVHELLKYGADPDVKGLHGTTALHFAVARGHVGVVEALLAAHANPDVKDEGFDNMTPLDIARFRNNTKIINMLCTHMNTLHTRMQPKHSTIAAVHMIKKQMHTQLKSPENL